MLHTPNKEPDQDQFLYFEGVNEIESYPYQSSKARHSLFKETKLFQLLEIRTNPRN